jgi:hypothetical protein
MEQGKLKVRRSSHWDHALPSVPYSGNHIIRFALPKGIRLKAAGLTIDTLVSVCVKYR